MANEQGAYAKRIAEIEAKKHIEIAPHPTRFDIRDAVFLLDCLRIATEQKREHSARCICYLCRIRTRLNERATREE